MREGRMRMGNKHRKKNLGGSVSYGGGGGSGIGGLVMFGGALAVAGFIAVTSLASKKSKTKDPLTKAKAKSSGKRQDEHEIETTEVVRSLLQHSTNPTTNDRDATCNGTTNVKSISQTSILEEKIEPVSDLNTNSKVVSPTCFHHQQIEFSDDSHPESVASSNDSEIEEGFLVSLFNSHDSQEPDVEPQESLNSIETEPQDDHVVSESCEEENSSKATQDPNEEPVFWPAEQDFKGEGGKIDTQNEAHGAARTVTNATNEATNVTPGETSHEKGNFSVVVNDQPSSSRLVQLTTWFMLMLLLALLLLLLLIRGTQQSFSVTIPENKFPTNESTVEAFS